MYILFFGFILLIVLWIIEYHNHQFWRKKIPLIIHVNGTRGKSSVVRLIAAGLRGGNKKVMAKTTGSAPAIIFEDGSETPIVRHYGANIKEQLKIIIKDWISIRRMNLCIITGALLNWLWKMWRGLLLTTIKHLKLIQSRPMPL